MTNTAVATGNAVRATFRSSDSPPRPGDVAEALESLDVIIGMLRVAGASGSRSSSVSSTGLPPFDARSFDAIDARVLSVRPGSIDIVLAVVGATSTSLTAIVVAVNTILGRSADMRTRRAQAKKVEAEAELAVRELRRAQELDTEYGDRMSRSLQENAAIRDENMRSVAADVEEALLAADVSGRLSFTPAMSSAEHASPDAVREDVALRFIWRNLIRVEIVYRR